MNRIAWVCGFGVLSVCASVWADSPSTAPVAPAPPTVYVQPFTPVSPAPGMEWVGEGVAQNLVSDLARTPYHPTAAVKPAASTADELTAAKAAGATYAVAGTYQWSAPHLRFDGQLLDVATGATVTGLTATGDGQDAFAIEDALSKQLIHHLRQASPVAPPAVPPALQPDALASAIHPPAGGVGSPYQGSALESYVNANRTPSVDYNQQLIDARDANTLGSYNNGFSGVAFSSYGGFGYGGPFGYGDYSVGGFGYTGYGYGGYAGFGTGGYLLGISYPVGSVGTYGIGGYGYTGYAAGFGGAGLGRGGFGFAGGRGSIGAVGRFGRR